MTSYSRRSRDYSRSRYRSPSYDSDRRSYSRSRSRSEDYVDVENPGNNLYVTGLSPRVTRRELEKHFSSEGEVVDVHLVMDPRTKESRGFGFVTMSTVKEADRCIKYLDRSVLGNRVITVEKAKRRRGRTPTPGKYLGLKAVDVRRRSPSYTLYRDSRSPSYSSDEGYEHRSRSSYYVRARYYSRSRSPHSRSPVRSRERSYSPYYRPRSRYDRSPYYRSSSRYDRSVSPAYGSRGRERSYSPRERSYSPYYRRRERSYSPHYIRRDRSYSPHYRGRDRSYSPSYSERDRSYSPPYGSRDRDRSYSPSDRRRSRYRSTSRSECSRDRMRRYRLNNGMTSSGRSIRPYPNSESPSRSSVASSMPRSEESRSPTPAS